MKKILIVEDDEFIRDIYLETLKAKGHEVDIALDGQEAYDKIKSNKYDLILLDIILPKITGLDLIKKLNLEGIQLKSTVIFTTNSDEGKELDEAKTLGAGYITKSSLTPDEFEKRITEFLK